MLEELKPIHRLTVEPIVCLAVTLATATAVWAIFNYGVVS